MGNCVQCGNYKAGGELEQVSFPGGAKGQIRVPAFGIAGEDVFQQRVSSRKHLHARGVTKARKALQQTGLYSGQLVLSRLRGYSMNIIFAGQSDDPLIDEFRKRSCIVEVLPLERIVAVLRQNLDHEMIVDAI